MRVKLNLTCFSLPDIMYEPAGSNTRFLLWFRDFSSGSRGDLSCRKDPVCAGNKANTSSGRSWHSGLWLHTVHDAASHTQVWVWSTSNWHLPAWGCCTIWWYHFSSWVTVCCFWRLGWFMSKHRYNWIS